MSEPKRDQTIEDVSVSGEANLPGVEPDELPDVGDLQQLVEDAETPRGSTEEAGPQQKG
jgi:hypothetical protein